MQLALTFLGIILLFLLVGVITFRLADRTNGRMISAGEKRTYLLHVPKSYDPSRPTSLVITIHGFVQWPAHQVRLSRWNDLAEEYGFLVVYPGGTRFPKRWRTGLLPGRQQAPSADIQFLSDLIDKLERDFNIDAKRIYANGLSNGGGMSFVLACALSDRIAAVGIVAGALPMSLENCQPARPVPVMMFHGTDDPIVPYGGGSFRREGSLPAIPEWVASLAQRSGCQATPRVIPPVGAVSGLEYTGCAADIVFYTIHGGGHTWPGGKPLPVWITGQTNTDIDASKTFWKFFMKHPLPKADQASRSLAVEEEY